MPTQLTTSHDANSGYTLYPSNSNSADVLWDGSLIFLAGDGASINLLRVASPSATTPSATTVKNFAVSGAGSSSITNGDIFVLTSGSQSDVWIAYAENNTVGGALVQHAVYDSTGTWTWDAATSCVGNGSGTVNQISVVWTGTYLIVGLRAVITGIDCFAVNYTTTKNGTSGWLSSLVQISSLSGNNTHYFGSLSHDSTLGCTVAVYTMHGDTLTARVLLDSSSPALANWGAEANIATGLSESDFQGAAVLLDHSSGRVHVLWYDTASATRNPGYVSGTISGTTITWGTPLSVGTASTSNDSPSLAIDGVGTVYAFWATGGTGSSSDICYATIASPYTSASAQTNLTNNSTNHNNHPMTPRRVAVSNGYIPLLYVSGTVSPYSIEYDNSIAAGTGAHSLVTQTRATFRIATKLSEQARSAFSVKTAVAIPTQVKYYVQATIATSGRGIFQVSTHLSEQSRATFNIRTALAGQTRATFSVRAVLAAAARSAFKVAAVLNSTAQSTFKIAGSAVFPAGLVLSFASAVNRLQSAFSELTRLAGSWSNTNRLTSTFTRSAPVAQPNSTIDVTATVKLPDGTFPTISTITVAVTFPDASSHTYSLANGDIVSLGSGQYKLTYTTKSQGNHVELWTFTATDGSTAQYKNITGCNY